MAKGCRRNLSDKLERILKLLHDEKYVGQNAEEVGKLWRDVRVEFPKCMGVPTKRRRRR